MADYIPPEVVVQILSWLPPKSLLRFRCVSKSWCAIITSPDFITMHTRHLSLSEVNRTYTRTIIRHFSKAQRKELYSVRFDNESFDLDLDVEIKFPFQGVSRFYFRIVGSCNGLLCLSDDLFGYTNTIILWNPAIRRKLTLPVSSAKIHNFYHLGTYMFVLGFGIDPKTNDYKVVRVAYKQGDGAYVVPPEVEVYTVKEGAWRGIGGSAAPMCCVADYFWSQTFINGAVHWVAYHWSGGRGSRVGCLILLFDMGEEIFREMMLPEALAYESPMNMYATVIRESFSVFQFDRYVLGKSSVWVMKDYGVAESWSKQFNVDLGEGLGTTMGLRKNGEILLVATNGELVAFNSWTGQYINLGIIGTRNSFYVDTYRESLALLVEGHKIWERQVGDSESDLSGEEDDIDGVEMNELWIKSTTIQFLTALLNEH